MASASQQPQVDENTHDNPPQTRGRGTNNALNTRNTMQHQNGDRAKMCIASLNIKGRRSGKIDKWMNVPQMMRERNIGILAVQETHLTDELADQFETLFGNWLSLIFSPDPNTRNVRGIAIILNKKAVRTEDSKTTVIIPGRAISVTIPWYNNQYINVLAIYAPNVLSETREFWKKIHSMVRSNPNLKPDVTLGDFNLVEDTIDRLPCKMDDHGAVEALREFKIAHNLIDGWRTAHPDEKGYTWSRESDGTQSRIDRIYIRGEFFNNCKRWDITPAPIPTDHNIVSAILSTPSSPVIGKGRWVVPTRLTRNKEIKRELQ